MRAQEPEQQGYVERDGIRVYYEVFGAGEPTVLFLPTWSLVDSRCWKAQVPYLARHGRVITFDGRGNGHSSRPQNPEAYADVEFAADALAVLDAVGCEQTYLVSLSSGANWCLLLAAEHPERVHGAVLIGHGLPVPPPWPERDMADRTFEIPYTSTEGWAKWNRQYWLDHYADFVEWFARQVFTEPYSTKQIEDAVDWAMETTPEILAATVTPSNKITSVAAVRDLASQVRCPVLVIHGKEDALVPYACGQTLAELIGGRLATIAGGGHASQARDPVKINLLLRDFISPEPPRSLTWTRGRNRQKRALYLSSPIGLGHAQRDAAIAAELRCLRPDVQIDWLAQHPVTLVLEQRGERIHPASALLASESRHFESESAEHDLHCFQAFRRMDEILVANYMLIHDVLNAEDYDLMIGDEAWEVDYFLHENPEEKRTAYVWLTDFVGCLPMPDGGEHERFLTSYYNAEMIEHVERFPRLRDRAIFVGNPDDIVPGSFGADLPEIRAWTERHFAFSGYVTGFDPAAFADREALRAQLGYHPDEQVCIVTVGGSGVGQHLLRRVIAAFPEAKRRVPALRMIVVTGPRIDPAALPVAKGLEVRAYVHELYRHLAACDLAVVQGGLSTCMELTANQRPFLYFPLRHHFEQNFHVRYRLERYGAGRCVEYATATPEVIAAAIAEEICRPVQYREVETDGAARAAAAIAGLI